MRNYGEALRYQREQHNLTQTALAKETGILQANISYWENNERVPSVENCERLADYYGITIDELIGRSFGEKLDS
ncbi:MAG: helix-turn-helix transcriptional regulator [Clostridia bacterium]|nr:helix-turn-helix transcriptional regulator [Clostridia bacterium]